MNGKRKVHKIGLVILSICETFDIDALIMTPEVDLAAYQACDINWGITVSVVCGYARIRLDRGPRCSRVID
jgi:hypothetical protein